MPTTVYTFIKLLEKQEHADQFRRGLLHMNTLRYFTEYRDANNELRGDKYEGVCGIFQPSQLGQIEYAGHVISGRDLVEPMLVHTHYHLDWNVFCLYALSSQGFEDGVSFDTLQAFKHAMQIHEQCYGLGAIAVQLTKPKLFLERAHTAVKKLRRRFRFDLVDYYDETSFHGVFDERDVPFKKRMRYKTQREYRLAIECPTETAGLYTLDIGDISDITKLTTPAEINATLEIRLPDGSTA